MANGSKVFVSPGVYTSEKDLSFVAQSVGVTTLGLVGEALKGSSLRTNFHTVLTTTTSTRFGGTSPQTICGLTNPKIRNGIYIKILFNSSKPTICN